MKYYGNRCIRIYINSFIVAFSFFIEFWGRILIFASAENDASQKESYRKYAIQKWKPKETKKMLFPDSFFFFFFSFLFICIDGTIMHTIKKNKSKFCVLLIERQIQKLLFFVNFSLLLLCVLIKWKFNNRILKSQMIKLFLIYIKNLLIKIFFFHFWFKACHLSSLSTTFFIIIIYFFIKSNYLWLMKMVESLKPST